MVSAIVATGTGTSISPISDTTIATSGTQGADIGGTVRARLKYVLPAGAAAAVAYLALAGPPERAVARAAVGARPDGWPMALVPALIVGMLLARRHLVEALMAGIVASIAEWA